MHVGRRRNSNADNGEDPNWIEVKELLNALNSSSGLLSTLSQLNFALAKGFAGIFFSIVLLNSISVLISAISLREQGVKTIDVFILQILPILFIILILVTILKDMRPFSNCLIRISLSLPMSFWILYFFSIFYAIIFALAYSVVPLLREQLNLAVVVHMFITGLGVLALVLSIYYFQRSNQMLYIIYEKSREKEL